MEPPVSVPRPKKASPEKKSKQLFIKKILKAPHFILTFFMGFGFCRLRYWFLCI